MMVRFCFCLFLLVQAAFAQEKFENKIVQLLEEENLPVEKAFVHTNKTTYFNDDVLWFQAYVGDKNNIPSYATTFLYVNLADANGQVLDSKNIFVTNGIGVGQFDLANINGSGRYFIQAYTNNMRNFGETACFVKEINILKESSTLQKTTKNQYDIQFFPEGGYLIDATENVLGVKVLVNGKGADFTGKILNSNNQEITNFKNEYLGMSSCRLKYASQETYQAIIQTNDTVLNLKIPKSEKKELLLSVDNSNPKLVVELKASQEFLDQSNSATYALLFHQNQTVLDFFQIDPKSMVNKKMEFNKEIFKNGVNTVTLFKNFEPLSERKFYIDNQNNELSFQLEKEESKNDSVVCNLKILNKDKPLKSSLSISVLPDTDEFKETTTIKSAFLLSPYVKGYIENPGYYFDPKNQKRSQHLDLLLLTQGFVQYSFSEMVATLNPKPKYAFEVGYTLKGTVSPLLTNYLGLLSKDNTLLKKIYLNGKNAFKFDELLFYKKDTIKISFLSQENIAFQPKKISLDQTNKTDFPKITVPPTTTKEVDKDLFSQKQVEELDFYYGTKLNEITVKGRKANKRNTRVDQLIEKYRSKVFDLGAYYEIELPEDVRKNNDLFMTFFLRDQGLTLVNWKGLENYLEVSRNKEAFLYVNGRRLRSEELSTLPLKMKDVESVMKQPFKSHIRYQVFTTENYINNVSEFFDEFVITDAYDKAKKYYVPAFNYDRPASLMEIDWKTNITTDDTGRSIFKIAKNNSTQKNIFSIQGFSDDGVLISEVVVK